MTIFGLLWVAHLPSSLGLLPAPAPATLLEATAWADRIAPVAPAPVAPASAPVAITPLQGLEAQPLHTLDGAVDWQRWTHTAAVTVVPTTDLADLTVGEAIAAHQRPKTLTSDTCPAAHGHSPGDKSPPAEPTADSSTTEASPEAPHFVVRVRGVAIGQVGSAAVAEQVATDLRSAMPTLAQRPQDLAPTLAEDQGIGQLQGQVVFSLPPEALAAESSMALTTAQWVNNLRLALGADPLSPSQVQRVAYGLDRTATRFQGTASWYGPYFHGRQTATGEIFDQDALTAAHKTLPFDTYLEVRNLLNGKTVVVRINDRGPYVGERSLDLSYAAARCLGSVQVGIIPYEATILAPGDAQPWENTALPL